MKWLWRLFKYLFTGLFIIITLVVILLLLDTDYQRKVVLEANKLPEIRKHYKPTRDSAYYKMLKAKFGYAKKLPKGYETQALIALSHYPELKKIPIEFVIEKAYVPLSSRPAPLSILFPWIKRKYLIVISNQSVKEFEPILLKNLPYNGQIGVIGHELAHTVFYLDKSAWQVAGMGWGYATSKNYQKSFERATDLRTVRHGLGYQLKSMSQYIYDKIEAEPSLRKAIGETKNNYYSPHEIDLEILKNINLYSSKN